MGKKYEQLSLEERCAIARLHEDGQSIRQIAANLDRAASTISRELKRNGTGDYKPAYADEQAWARRWRGSRMERLAGPAKSRAGPSCYGMVARTGRRPAGTGKR
jgi:IS30 family transposase